MVDMQFLFKTVDALTSEELKLLHDYIEQRQQSESISTQEPRVFDMHAGEIWISEDFTDPLPDEFWTGEV
ncbi:MAG: DUF2281 domain-containing protein [Anaerolineae bacterium]|nr:DUF2281 domain-containing protein [Anaerolineae bacterium]